MTLVHLASSGQGDFGSQNSNVDLGIAHKNILPCSEAWTALDNWASVLEAGYVVAKAVGNLLNKTGGSSWSSADMDPAVGSHSCS